MIDLLWLDFGFAFFLTPPEPWVKGLGSAFRGGLVFKVHRPLHHSTLGLRVVKKQRPQGS